MSRNILQELQEIKGIVKELNNKFPENNWHPEQHNFYADLNIRQGQWFVYCADYYLMITPVVKCYLQVLNSRHKKVSFKVALIHPVTIELLEKQKSKYFI